jgi:hypothetical protein
VVLVLVRLLLQLFLKAASIGFVCFSLLWFPFISTIVLVIAYLFSSIIQKCVVDLPGGPLEIEWRQSDNHIYMTGPAEAVFYGSVLH